METKTLSREFINYTEWKFTLTETSERTYDLEVEKSLVNLRELKVEIDKIPVTIENLEWRKLKLIDLYNEWVELLEEAKEKLEELKDLEIPNKI